MPIGSCVLANVTMAAWFLLFTLLNWILLVSRVVCDKPGNRCFRQSRRLSALLASVTFLSSSSAASSRCRAETAAAASEASAMAGGARSEKVFGKMAEREAEGGERESVLLGF